MFTATNGVIGIPFSVTRTDEACTSASAPCNTTSRDEYPLAGSTTLAKLANVAACGGTFNVIEGSAEAAATLTARQMATTSRRAVRNGQHIYRPPPPGFFTGITLGSTC